jgi:nucleoside phosphorylase
MIAILGALQPGIVEIKQALEGRRLVALQEAGWSVRAYTGLVAGQNILLIQSGMGRENAQRAAACAWKHCATLSEPLRCLVSLGFGGGLTPDAAIGDLLLCKKSLSDDDQAQPYDSSDEIYSLALRSIQDCPLTYRSGTCLTAAQPVAQPEQKAALAARYQAQVVDMENYWVASFAAAHRLPFLGIRAISDIFSEVLPPFDRLISSQGAPVWKQAIPHFLAHPGDLAALPRLYQSAAAARKSLGLFFCAFISTIKEAQQ